MRVRNFIMLVTVILVTNKQLLYSDKWELIRNDQDLGNVFLLFSMLVRHFPGLVRVILDLN